MKKNIIEEYINIITKIQREKVSKTPSGKNFRKSISQKYKLSKLIDWDHYLSVIYLLEDTELAKKNFYDFGISGPTKYDEMGEKYLRLYGILNAISLQKEAILKLIEIFKINNLKKLSKELSALKIIIFRNIAASHTVNYNSNDGVKSYMLSRITIDKEKIDFLDEKNQTYHINIINEIENFNDIIIQLLESITEKIINTVYSTEKERKSKYLADLSELRDVRDGKLIISGDIKVSFK
ncbi:hypothetical protein [Leptospira vanthielii]|uniref:Uncharacterized protein n=1 Tax=Leptospira vanthielii TaxID=293085 RepID=A0ABY2NT93_9LEPT|nr:hypothetical protein [Leptospira vanthielii]TGM60814.1 hypothetical protein EHQ95_02770 [Leptospira vanthielii]